jgi:prolipoprotein diacylglyceryltransferase
MILQPLSVVWNFDPVLFSIGSLDIRYYGLMGAGHSDRREILR